MEHPNATGSVVVFPDLAVGTAEVTDTQTTLNLTGTTGVIDLVSRGPLAQQRADMAALIAAAREADAELEQREIYAEYDPVEVSR